MSIFGRRAGRGEGVVVRIPPSPTGHLHIGTARTALFNFLYAQKHGGRIVFRSEDTDRERSRREYEDEIVEGLHWFGITWDEFYRQSERSDIYRKYLEQLIAGEKAYISREPGKHNPEETVEVVRLKNPGSTITFEDEVRGEVTFDTTELGDFVIARSLDDPLYHLTVVVDDFEMGVTDVVRGEDHISNTPRQILIQEALGAPRPRYAHLPLILAPDRSRLSKRHGAVALNEYREQGFLPEALINYLALLGWNPGTDQEVFTLDELIHAFDLGGVQKGGAIFSLEKLRWFNKQHLAGLSDSAYRDYALLWLMPHVETLPQFSSVRAEKLLPTIRERAEVGTDIAQAAEAGEYDFAFDTPLLQKEMLPWKKDPSPEATLRRLRRVAEIIATLPETSDPDAISEPLFAYAETEGKGQVLWPLRVALTGRERSPDPITVIHVIGTAEAYRRVTRACDTITSA